MPPQKVSPKTYTACLRHYLVPLQVSRNYSEGYMSSYFRENKKGSLWRNKFWNLSYQAVFYMTKKSWQKSKYLKNIKF